MAGDIVFEVTVALGIGLVPEVHVASWVLTIGWSSEVGVVDTIGLDNHIDGVVSASTLPVVVVLEVVCSFSKAILVVNVLI